MKMMMMMWGGRVAGRRSKYEQMLLLPGAFEISTKTGSVRSSSRLYYEDNNDNNKDKVIRILCAAGGHILSVIVFLRLLHINR
jgi:hypothetical protein